MKRDLETRNASAQDVAPGTPHSQHLLQCMDIWSGNRSIENEASTPGIEIFAYSRPCGGEKRGGDVYYISLCAGGVITRVILADVAGHGAEAATTSQMLRSLMRRHINAKNQRRLVAELNRKFTQRADSGRFATAIVATYLSHRNRFLICNAGHPRPLRYRHATASWSPIEHEQHTVASAANLPLGVSESTQYQHFELEVDDGDMIVLYTDAWSEARNRGGQLLGEDGLLQMVAGTPTDSVRRFGSAMLERIHRYSGHEPADDDATLIVLRFSAGSRRIPGVRERLAGYSKVLGLRPV